MALNSLICADVPLRSCSPPRSKVKSHGVRSTSQREVMTTHNNTQISHKNAIVINQSSTSQYVNNSTLSPLQKHTRLSRCRRTATPTGGTWDTMHSTCTKHTAFLAKRQFLMTLRHIYL